MGGLQDVQILLVEDSASDAELILRALSRSDPAGRVHVAKDGAQAIECFFGPEGMNRPPRLVLMDLHLPRIDGIEVLRNLKADAHFRTIPVVVLTSSRQGSDLQECYRLGVNIYIVKPVEFECFTDAISDLGSYWMQLNEPPGKELKSA